MRTCEQGESTRRAQAVHEARPGTNLWWVEEVEEGVAWLCAADGHCWRLALQLAVLDPLLDNLPGKGRRGRAALGGSRDRGWGVGAAGRAALGSSLHSSSCYSSCEAAWRAGCDTSILRLTRVSPVRACEQCTAGVHGFVASPAAAVPHLHPGVLVWLPVDVGPLKLDWYELIRGLHEESLLKGLWGHGQRQGQGLSVEVLGGRGRGG